MNELEAIRWHLTHYQARLGQQIDRVYNALEELQRTTLLLLSLHAQAPSEAIDSWLEHQHFAIDTDGFFQSQSLVTAYRAGLAPEEAISLSWGKHLQHHPIARNHLFAHRNIGRHLHHLHQRLGHIGWIYYQDASNVALQYPFIDQVTAIPYDFQWSTYHTYTSVNPENNPSRTIQWTPPSIDYAGEGLILSVSIPVWQENQFIGLWSIDLPLRYLYQDFALTKAFPDQEQWIADAKGMLLLHHHLQAQIDKEKGSILLHPLSDLGGDWQHLDPSILQGECNGELRIKDGKGLLWLISCIRVPKVNWILFCALPEPSLEEAGARRLQDGFQQVATGNYAYRIQYAPSNATIASLTEEFNKMSVRLEQAEKARERIEKQLRQAQKMEAVGQLAGGVAHDYNNMLSVIMGYTEMALEEVDQGKQLYADLLQIQDAAKRSMKITRQLLAFARCQPIAPQVLDLNATVAGMLRMLSRLIGENIELIWEPGQDIWPIHLDPSQIDQILANLCINARDAIRGEGKVLIETANVELDQHYCAVHEGFIPGQFAQLIVTDDGIGMEPKTLNRIFEPFFSTKAIGQGTGLGLATVYGIIKQNKGFINVYSEPEKGTTFKLYLPRTQPIASTHNGENAPEMVTGNNEKVLVVEDEIAILQLTERMLEQLGYCPLIAAHHSRALELAQTHGSAIQFMLTDVVMPDMNGQELAQKIKKIIPNIKVLYMSGYTANVIVHRGVLDPGVSLLQKPFDKKELATKIGELFQGHDTKTP